MDQLIDGVRVFRIQHPRVGPQRPQARRTAETGRRPLRPAASFCAEAAESGTLGSTRLFRLFQNSQISFSLSLAEIYLSHNIRDKTPKFLLTFFRTMQHSALLKSFLVQNFFFENMFVSRSNSSKTGEVVGVARH